MWVKGASTHFSFIHDLRDTFMHVCKEVSIDTGNISMNREYVHSAD